MRHREYRGKTALVYYRGGAAGEEIVEDHSPAVQSEPERILLGSGEVPLGVSDVLYDMEVGEERRAVIPCDRPSAATTPKACSAMRACSCPEATVLRRASCSRGAIR